MVLYPSIKQSEVIILLLYNIAYFYYVLLCYAFH
jgi:hypothetical protein